MVGETHLHDGANFFYVLDESATEAVNMFQYNSFLQAI